MELITIATQHDIVKLIPALLELRTNKSANELTQMLQQQLQEGFQIAYIGNVEMAFSIIGFRSMTMLHSGKTLYIDDLVTHSQHRRKGYAKQLLEWIKNYVKKNDYDTLSLDSAFHRTDAYRLYLNSGFEVTSLHFAIAVKKI